MSTTLDNPPLVTCHHTIGYLHAIALDLAIIEHSPSRYTLLPYKDVQRATKQNAVNNAKLDLLDAVSRAKWLGLSDSEIAAIVVKLLNFTVKDK